MCLTVKYTIREGRNCRPGTSRESVTRLNQPKLLDTEGLLLLAFVGADNPFDMALSDNGKGFFVEK
jgi:hypothetical protein